MQTSTNLIRFIVWICLLSSSFVYAQAPQWKWVNGVGSGHPYYDEGDCIATDKNGNVYISGHFEGDYLVAGADTLWNVRSLYLIKYDSLGNVLWTKNPPFVGTTPTAKAYAHAVTTDKDNNVYITGEYILMQSITFDDTTITPSAEHIDVAFVAKYSPSGNLLWVRDAPSDNCESLAITVDKDNNVYIAGEFGGDPWLFDTPRVPSTITFSDTTFTNTYSGNSVYGFITKYDASGNVLWARAITSTGPGTFEGPEAVATGITTDIIGNVYVTGYFSSNATFETTTLTSTKTNTYNPFVAKYDASGNVLWARNGTPSEHSKGKSIVTSGCFVYVTGFSNSAITFDTFTINAGMFITQYDVTGNVVWAKSPTTKNGGSHSGSGITVDISGNVYVTGAYSDSLIDFGNSTVLNSKNSANSEAFVVKYNSLGVAIWAKDGGGQDYDHGNKIATDNRGNLYTIGGIYSDSTLFDDIPLNNSFFDFGAPTFFTAKLAQNVVPTPISTLSLDTIAKPDTCKRHVGTASVTASGGTAPYTYSWSPGGDTTATITGLGEGIYIVTVIDATGCEMAIDTAIVGDVGGSGNFTVSVTQTNLKCNGDNNGTATATPAGSTFPFTYSWTPNTTETDSIATGLTAGSYTVTVTDNTGCPIPTTITITEPEVLATTLSDTLSCNGNRTTNAITTGGTRPYSSWSWTPNTSETDSSASNLTTGTYTVTVTDANNCTATATKTITPYTVLSTTTVKTNILCKGENTGTATTTPSGGTPPYDYLWAPAGGLDSIASNLAAGTYTVTVNDENNCVTTSTVTITEPATPLVVTTSQTHVTCNGQNNGTASVAVTGGTGPYAYSWNTTPVNTTSGIANLQSGVYRISVTDAASCTKVDSVVISEPAPLLLNLNSTDANCSNALGNASVSVTGGTNPYAYAWNTTPVNTTSSLTNLAAGTYKATVTDAKGCSASSGNVVITDIKPSLASFTPNPMEGEAPLEVAFTNTSTSTGALTYQWIFGDGTSSTAASPTNIYTQRGSYDVTLIATSSTGCLDTMTYTIKVNSFSSLSIPNVFTPNGDGLNDVFKVTAKNMREFRIVIYNRWGTKIFESTNPDDNWNGLDCEDGTYYYVIDAIGVDEKPYPSYAGFVSLISKK